MCRAVEAFVILQSLFLFQKDAMKGPYLWWQGGSVANTKRSDDRVFGLRLILVLYNQWPSIHDLQQIAIQLYEFESIQPSLPQLQC